jgi:endonuclease I
MIAPSMSWGQSYSVGDAFVDYGCTATDNVDGTIDCTTVGTVDTNTIGEYTLTFTATDTAGNTASVQETFVVLRDDSLLEIDLDPYYDSAEGLYGDELLLALRAILNSGDTLQTYGDARYILDETDADPLIPGNLILLYLGTSVSGVWDAGATWNREHIWPQSLLGVDAENSTANEASDLHNLAPADPGTNSSRGNKYYADATTTVSYAPRAAVRGDIARSLFYMIVMYDQYTLVDGEPGLYQMGDRATLIQWFYDDPVSAFEIARNNVIYSYQNNRNPFVDYSHLLELIYYDEGLPVS